MRLFFIILLLLTGVNRTDHPISIENSTMFSPHISWDQSERNIAMSNKILLENIKGQKYCRLKILKEVEPIPLLYKGNRNGYIRKIECECDCGNIFITKLQNILSGHTKSCGCLQKDFVTGLGKVQGKKNITHNKTNHILYKCWRAIKNRCNVKTNISYPHYGMRGITICEEWDKSFGSFYNWAINNGWVKGLTIDRTDNNGNYEPSNCRWVTSKINSRNKRTTKLNEEVAFEIRKSYNTNVITYDELAKRYKVSLSTISDIIKNRTWT